MIQKMKSTLAALLESFFRHRLVAQRGASPATVVAYRDALRLFLVFASKRAGKPPSRLGLDELDRDMVLAFLDHLEQQRNNSTRTRNVRLAAIRSFFQHVAYCDPAGISLAQRILSIQGKRTTKRLIGYLRQPELEAILAAPERTTPLGRRDHALLLFLARTGARVSEAIGVDAAELSLQRPCQVLLHGKRGIQRVVPLEKDIAAVLKALLDERGVATDSQTPVFVNARGLRLTRKGVNHILTRAVTIAAKTKPGLGERAISPHTMRHSLAMQLLQSGVELSTIQSWLGHASINTTHQYVEADLEMKRRALEKCNNPETSPTPYQPTDEVLAFLESL
jgi:site-specific recombinase XerD